ncbi:MAG TPA: class I SAM-dependent methyltransferase [Candidatus Paceibacterota bacterium]
MSSIVEHEFYSQPSEVLKKRKFIEYKTQYIDRFFPKDKTAKILDLGCSYGLFLDACNRCDFLDYEGVDFDDEAVNYARREFGLKNIFKDDLFKFLNSRPDNNYDIITAFNIIEHIKKERVLEMLDLISRKIKKGGSIYIEVPNGDSPIGIHTFYSDITHEFAYTKSLMIRLLQMAGFEEIKVIPNRVRSNLIVRLAQKVLAKVVGFDDKLMFSGNIMIIGQKKP